MFQCCRLDINVSCIFMSRFVSMRKSSKGASTAFISVSLFQMLTMFYSMCNHPACRPAQPEIRMHRAARRDGLGLQCEIELRDLPMCVGHDQDGQPMVEIVSWPFILPKTIVPGKKIKVCMQYKDNMFSLIWGFQSQNRFISTKWISFLSGIAM